jgi:hypothetical protein
MIQFLVISLSDCSGDKVETVRSGSIIGYNIYWLFDVARFGEQNCQ